jgi:hypothetical protein
MKKGQTQYTRIGDSDLERRLSAWLREIAADLETLDPASRPLAVYLGGGYGRGDGGVAVKAEGSSLYNDLDFFVFGKNFLHCRRVNRALQSLHRKWSEILNVEVDFSLAKSERRLSSLFPTLMFQELLQGHEQIYGDRDVLAGLPRLPPTELPAIEGFRLLLNRGAGILFAAEQILAPSGMDCQQRDFAVRNLHKAVLGCGDALLLTQGRYRWKSDERLEELRTLQLPFIRELSKAYNQALDFRALPRQDDKSDLLRRCEQTRQLWCSCLLASMLFDHSERKQSIGDLQKRLLDMNCTGCRNPIRNALRWLLKTAEPLPWRKLTAEPVLRVLLELCEIMFENPIAGNYINSDFFSQAGSYRGFVKHWEIFN